MNMFQAINKMMKETFSEVKIPADCVAMLKDNRMSFVSLSIAYLAQEHVLRQYSSFQKADSFGAGGRLDKHIKSFLLKVGSLSNPNNLNLANPSNSKALWGEYMLSL